MFVNSSSLAFQIVLLSFDMIFFIGLDLLSLKHDIVAYILRYACSG